jgi:hypothetical protein
VIVHHLVMSLCVFVPVPITHGWAWGAASEEMFPPAEEVLQDLAELPRVLRSYGKAVAQIIRPRNGDRFNVTAFDSTTGQAQGRDCWVWDSEFRVFRPDGTPWVPCLTRDRLLTVQRTPVQLVPVPQPDQAATLRVIREAA